MVMSKNYRRYTKKHKLVDRLPYSVSPRVKEILKSVKIVTKNEFVNMAKPCDIVVAFAPKKIWFESRIEWLESKLMAVLQRVPYSSGKLVLNNGDVAGYGITSRGIFGSTTVDTMKLKYYLKDIQRACLIKVPDLTEKQKKEIIDYVKKRIGLRYSLRQVWKSAWNRMLRALRLKSKVIEPFLARDVKKLQVPLVCSNLISTAFWAAGYKKPFDINVWEVWPKDFILSDFTEKVCRIEYNHD